jgi:hypothetical protein
MPPFLRRAWPLLAAAAAGALLTALVFLLTDVGGDGDGGTVAQPTADSSDVGAYNTVLTPPVEQSTSAPPPVPIGTVLTASDADLKAFVGQDVAAAPVNVLRRIGPSAAWVGDSAANRVLVLLVSPENPFTFEAGAKLTFTGTVAAASAELGKQLGLKGEELADFTHQGTIIEVGAYSRG